MYSAEVLSQLRSLNWLLKEARLVPAGSPESVHLQTQIDSLRARLPNSILGYHDRLVKRGLASAVEVTGTGCPACHLKLPSGLLGELAVPGRFGICPNCGVFLWSAEPPAAVSPPAPPPAKRARRKAAGV